MKKTTLQGRMKSAGFTLVEIMIVVLIIGILLAIAIPNFVAARETSRTKACVANLNEIDSATQQYCMDQKQSAANYNAPTLDATPVTGIVGSDLYIRAAPVCPSGGAYTTATTITGNPTCSIATGATTVDYEATGKYYHGL
jgi:prepilin-type N-terminal cleavage/methylation domain-containing protein